MSHFALSPLSDGCPKCSIAVESEFVRSGITKEGRSVAFAEFLCKSDRVRWVMIVEIGTVKRLF